MTRKKQSTEAAVREIRRRTRRISGIGGLVENIKELHTAATENNSDATVSGQRHSDFQGL